MSAWNLARDVASSSGSRCSVEFGRCGTPQATGSPPRHSAAVSSMRKLIRPLGQRVGSWRIRPWLERPYTGGFDVFGEPGDL